ncbi:transposase [Streptomyces sp. NPDC020412]|uniref:transposase n=1 Tax=Streptomyces sp. NPDC020412 TaxID=3365073 RepID=UPI0037B240E0
MVPALPRTWGSASSEADLGKAARRAVCGIPDDVGHVEEWQLALDMFDETRSWGIEVPLAVARVRRCCRVLARGAGPRPVLRGGDLHHAVGSARRGGARWPSRTPGPDAPRWRGTRTSRSR